MIQKPFGLLENNMFTIKEEKSKEENEVILKLQTNFYSYFNDSLKIAGT